MKEKQKQKVLNIKDVAFTDLEGNKVPVNIDQKEFGNALYRNATSLEVDAFAREIYSEGIAQVAPDLMPQLIEIVTRLYGFRASQAIKETIENS